MTNAVSGAPSWTKYGLALGGFLVLYGVLFRVLGLDSSSPLTWLFYLAQPVILVWLVRSATSVSRSRRFGGCVAAAALGNSIYVGYVYLFNRFVDDSLIRDSLARQLTALQASELAASQIVARTAALERSFTPFLFSVNVFVALMAVALLSALLLVAWPTNGSRTADGRESSPETKAT